MPGFMLPGSNSLFTLYHSASGDSAAPDFVAAQPLKLSLQSLPSPQKLCCICLNKAPWKASPTASSQLPQSCFQPPWERPQVVPNL